MAYEYIIYEKRNGIGIITLNRPETLNAINAKLCDELESVISDIECDPEVRVIIITGSEKSFSSGADIKESPSVGVTGKLGNLCFRLGELDKPVIAAVSGYALGGGFQLALACDLRIASDTARFALPEIKLGFAPMSGAMSRLPRLIGVTKAKEILLTGDFINVHEAYRVGLLNKVVPLSLLKDEAVKIATTILAYPGHLLKIAKKCVDLGMGMSLDQSLAFEAAYVRSELGTFDAQAIAKQMKQTYLKGSRER